MCGWLAGGLEGRETGRPFSPATLVATPLGATQLGQHHTRASPRSLTLRSQGTLRAAGGCGRWLPETSLAD